MRGRDERGEGLFSYVDLESRAPASASMAARWLFFAEARHTVMLYYGADAA